MSASPSAALSFDSSNIYAQNVRITHGVHHTQAVSPQRDPMEILHKHVAFGALYNSGERFDPPRCHPNTRTAVQDRIERWADDTSDDATSILWLSGPAGAGKSAIAQTLVEKWKIRNVMVIAFFFWRTASERNQKTRLVPTIALQLSELFPSTKTRIEAAIRIGGFFSRGLSFQLEKLVIEPLLAEDQGSQRVIIVIDGLDECCADLPRAQDFPGQTHESQQQEILDMFGSACRRTSSIRLMIVSRPERQIRASFGTGLLEEVTTSLSLKDAENASADIRLFLDCSFQEIRKRYGIDSSWPTEEQLSKLVRKSSGQFIYPSIAVKHITRTRANPKRSLMAVLELEPGSGDNPLAELDMLYTLVLKSVAEASLPVVTDILGYILLPVKYTNHLDFSPIFDTKQADRSLSMFGTLLFLHDGEAELHLDDLHSVLDIPPRATDRPIRFIHATFSEYLQDGSRAGNFVISHATVYIRYTELLFRHLNHWGMCPDGHIYDGRFLTERTWLLIIRSPPSRGLMIHLWSLMRIKLGYYPLAGRHANKNSLPLARKQPQGPAQFDSQLNILDKTYRKGPTRDLLVYLQKCNIPEIEPNWLRRYLVRRRLEVALRRHPGDDSD